MVFGSVGSRGSQGSASNSSSRSPSATTRGGCEWLSMARILRISDISAGSGACARANPAVASKIEIATKNLILFASDYSRYAASQSENVLYQSRLFCGFRIQSHSSGYTTNFDG